jgi:hypothetical protein
MAGEACHIRVVYQGVVTRRRGAEIPPTSTASLWLGVNGLESHCRRHKRTYSNQITIQRRLALAQRTGVGLATSRPPARISARALLRVTAPDRIR